MDLLLSCKGKGSLSNLSDRLGDFVRTNSEAILAVTSKKKEVNYSEGIAISAGFYPDEDTHIELGRYPAGSDFMSLVATLLTDGGPGIPRVLRLLGNILLHPFKFLFTLWPFGWARRTVILTVMQPLDNYLRLRMRRRWWWPFGDKLDSDRGEGPRIPSYIPNLTEAKHPATWVRLGWHLYHQAARRGAVGFIGIVKHQPGGSCRMYAPYGFKEKDILDKPLPGFWVGWSDGAELCRLARTGSGRARIKLSGIREQGVTHNIVGEIPGKIDEAIVLGCHHDSPFESPVEDATGVSVVLALAKHFAKRRDLDRRLIILFSAGHFYGSIGTRTFIREHRSDIVRRTVAEISVEHIAHEAVEDANGRLVPSGLPEATGIFVPLNQQVANAVLGSIEANDVRRVALLPVEGPFGDYPPTDGGDWYEAGVPVINFICNPVYLLTADDALEWVARDRLAKVAGAFADVIRKLDDMPRHDIGAVDSWRRALLMKLLKHVARAKTTFFGLKPVY